MTAGTLLIIQGSLVLLLGGLLIAVIFLFPNDDSDVLSCFLSIYLIVNSLITLVIGISVISIGKNEEKKIEKLRQNVSSFPQ